MVKNHSSPKMQSSTVEDSRFLYNWLHALPEIRRVRKAIINSASHRKDSKAAIAALDHHDHKRSMNLGHVEHEFAMTISYDLPTLKKRGKDHEDATKE